MSRYGPHDPASAPAATTVLAGGIRWGWPDGATRSWPVPRLAPTPREELARQRARINELAAAPVASWCSWHQAAYLEADCPSCRQGLPPVDAE